MSTIKQNFFVLCLIKGLDLFGKYNFIITADALCKCLVKAEEQKRIVLHIIVLQYIVHTFTFLNATAH